MTIEDPLEFIFKEEPEDFKLIDYLPRVELERLDDEEIQKLSNKPKEIQNEFVRAEKNKKVCIICDKSFQHLELHLKRVHSIKSQTKTRVKPEKHRQITEQKLENEPEVCPYCKRLRRNLKFHIRRAHLKNKNLTCDFCGFGSELKFCELTSDF